MSEKIEMLENDVQKLKNIVWVVGAVAVVFGVSGGFGFNIIKESREEIKTLETKLNELNSTTDETKSKLVKIRENEEEIFIGHIKEQKDAIAIKIKGAIVAFESNNCPIGWEDYTKAYGMFIRGLDKSGTKIDPDGKREPGGKPQVDLFKEHSHQVASSYLPVTSQPNVALALTQSYKLENTSFAGGSETRPKNIALLYCRKL